MRLISARNIGLVLACAWAAGPSASQAKPLSERQLLSRCYSHLTGERPAPTDPIWNELATKKAINVCLDLLKAVRLDASGVLVQPANPVHRKVLRQFHDLHRSWLERQSFPFNDFGDGLFGTGDVYDPAEASLHVTRAMFVDGSHYGNALRGFDQLEAARDVGSVPAPVRATKFIDGSASLNDSLVIYSEEAGTPEPSANRSVNVPLIGLGPLLGVRPRPAAQPLPVLRYRRGANNSETALADSPLVQMPHDPLRNFGGGAIGSQAFLLINFGHDTTYRTNGTTKLPRRWVQSAIKAFLCRTGPYVRPADAAGYVRDEPSAPSFRKATSCLRCHSTLDQAALVARNLFPGSSIHIPNQENKRAIATIGAFKATAGPSPGQDPRWPWQAVDSFGNQAPSGQLYLRTMTGALKDRPVASLDDLGAALTETDDYWACAAARYVRHFVGVQVNLYDPYDDSNAALAASETDQQKKWKEFVVAIAKELRTTGSIKRLVQRIMESDAYAQSDFGR